MAAPLVITRQTKTGDVSPVLVNHEVANVYPKTVVVTKQGTSSVTPVPGEMHLPVPLGPAAREVTLEFGWNMNSPPCAGTFTNTLKNWTGNSLYKLVTAGSLLDEGIDGWYLAKAIGYSRDRTGMYGGLPRWAVNMQLVKCRDVDVTDCPAFDDTTVSGTPSTGTTPYFKMVNVTTPTELIETKLTKINIKHSGAVQSFPLYDEEAITILPPLGNTGPVAEISFRIQDNDDYATIKSWAVTRNLIVAINQETYPEFDNDADPTYYSRWIINNISIQRAPSSGGALTKGVVERVVNMSLTRYWRYKELEVDV